MTRFANPVVRKWLPLAIGLGLVGALAIGLELAGAPRAAPGSAPESDVRCLALTIYWEAREEGRPGMVAVGWVVLNRRRSAKYPSTVCEVVREGGQTPPCQFSYWCDGRRDEPEESEAWSLARAIATELLSTPPADPTHGAVFYHRVGVRPAWKDKQQQTARIGKHVYYR